MQTEREWYGTSWKILRTELIKICTNHSSSFLELVHNNSPNYSALTHDFMNNVINDVSAMIAEDRLGLWQNALPLLIHPDTLAREFERDHEALCGTKMDGQKHIQPIQAFLRKLLLHFETARRELVASGMGISSNKLKTWERLDSISRKVARANEGVQRCTEDHFHKLAEHISLEHKHDKNLPRRANTVKDYFYLFSGECMKDVEDIEDVGHKTHVTEAAELLQGTGKAELLHCLQTLEQQEMELIDVAFGLGIGKVVHTNVKSYLNNRSLTRNQFQDQKDTIMDKLRQCLELALASHLGGYVL